MVGRWSGNVFILSIDLDPVMPVPTRFNLRAEAGAVLRRLQYECGEREVAFAEKDGQKQGYPPFSAA